MKIVDRVKYQEVTYLRARRHTVFSNYILFYYINLLVFRFTHLFYWTIYVMLYELASSYLDAFL